MPFVGPPLRVERPDRGRRLWRLLEDRTYQGQIQAFKIPAGTTTDLATIPKLFRWLFDPDGPWIDDAILHDWLITEGIRLGLVTSRDADGLFRRAMREDGVTFPARWTLWAAVRIGALLNPARARGRQFLRDLPAVVLVGLVAAPLLLPAVLGIGISYVLLVPFRLFRLHIP